MDHRTVCTETIPDIVSQMTLEEKALLVTGNSVFTTYPVERLGVPSINLLDGATGINFYQLFLDAAQRMQETEPDKPISPSVLREIRDHLLLPEELSPEAKHALDRILSFLRDRLPEGDYLPGCFPPGMLLGATWDPETVRNCGSAVGKEAAAYHVDVLLGPNVNLHRDPRNGRIYEGYSEDPCLASALAPAFVQGVQDSGVMADVKHFAANNQETFRHNIDERIPQRALQELYLPAFKACVNAGVKTVMSAYNQINGKPCAMNTWLLTDVLRKTWGFEGTIISDWGAAYDQVEALRAGNDLDMPGKRDVTPIIQAVRSGALDESCLDRAVCSVLHMVAQTLTAKGTRPQSGIDRAFSKKAAYQAAAEGIVLLKNTGVLPLNAGARLSFFGRRSNRFVECGNGSTLVHTHGSTFLIEACGQYAAQTSFDALLPDTDAIVVTACATGQEGSDRAGLSFDPGEEEMIRAALEQADEARKPAILLLNVSGPVDLREYIDRFAAVICLFLPGMEGAHAAADILFGAVNPSGKLPLTFPMRIEDVPAWPEFPGTPTKTEYGEGIYVGYRYYDAKRVRPMFPFGFGLSYTEFEISDLRISRSTLDLDADESILVSVSVRNVGERDGREVIQMYLSDPVSTLPKPPKELKAFQKIFLRAGESTTVTFALSADMLRSFDEERGEWTAEAGRYELLVGNSSDCLPLCAGFSAVGHSPYSLGKHSPMIRFLMNPEADALLRECMSDCGWDYSQLNETMQSWPEQQMIQTLTILYPYSEQEARWERFFEEAERLPADEFSFRDVIAWEIEHVLLM